jgi:hypothetical protein
VRGNSCRLEDNIKRNLRDWNVGRNKSTQERNGGRLNVKEGDFK